MHDLYACDRCHQVSVDDEDECPVCGHDGYHEV